MCKEDYGIKNTATIDIERYNFLLNKEKAFNEYFEDDNVALIIEKDKWKNDEYRVITVDSAVKEIGAIHNKYVNNSVPQFRYDELVERYDDLARVAEMRLETIEEQNIILSDLKAMSTREFKRWKKRN